MGLDVQRPLSAVQSVVLTEVHVVHPSNLHTERGRERDRETERETHRERDTERETQRETQRDTERERKRQRPFCVCVNSPAKCM